MYMWNLLEMFEWKVGRLVFVVSIFISSLCHVGFILFLLSRFVFYVLKPSFLMQKGVILIQINLELIQN